MISATGHIPTQLLIGRHVKTNLPTPLSALQSCQSSPEDFRENDNKAKLSYSRHCDHRHGARSLLSLLPGDEVRVKTPQQSYWSQRGAASTPDGATIATHENNQRICWQTKSTNKY